MGLRTLSKKKKVAGHVGYTPGNIHNARRVLNLFFDNKDKSFNKSSIAYLTYTPNLDEELVFLTHCKIIKISKNNHLTKVYSLNKEYYDFFKGRKK